MTANEALFLVVPAIAVFCNVFLLIILLTAKKTKVIYSFILLLLAVIMWTAGSFLMRLQIYPGITFWWEVSITGVFLVPFFYYLLAKTFSEKKGNFLTFIWGGCTLILIILNIFDVFMAHPQITYANTEYVFGFTLLWPSIFPVLFAICVFCSVFKVVSYGIKENGIPVSQFRPIFIGIAVLAIGVTIDMIPFMSTFPNDTLACAINSVCIYYALHKRRLYPSNPLLSKGSIYFFSLAITCAVFLPSLQLIEGFITRRFFMVGQYMSAIVSILFFVVALLISAIIGKLYNGLFIKDKVQRDTKLKEFSLAINKTLRLNDIIAAYLALLHDVFPAHLFFFCLYSEPDKCYWLSTFESELRKKMAFDVEHPLVRWISNYDAGMSFRDFLRTSYYKSMWESEKDELLKMKISFVVPIWAETQLVGMTFFTENHSGKKLNAGEISFLESVSSVVSIAIKNANLYETMHKEAQQDSLTGLYNRRYFNERLVLDFERCKGNSISVILFNLDDFSLYNELYGSGEGDYMLQRFAQMLRAVIGLKGTIARYGGKEFSVSVPFCDAAEANEYASKIKLRLSEYMNGGDPSTRKHLTFSAGICSSPTAASNPDQLVSYANLAVYSAKKNGKNRCIVYTRTTVTGDLADKTASKKTIADEYSSTIFALTAAIDAKDHYTFNHSQCVATNASILAAAAGLDEEHVEIVRQAGLLHDIGKIGIPDAILTKTGKLTDDEFTIMRQHVERSIEMIRHLPSLDYVIPVVLGHHERYDGKGYPRGIAGESIPIGARCLTIVDSFDAMTSRRSYKDAMPVGKALDEMRRNLGKHFDPELGLLFVNLVEQGKTQLNLD